MSESYRQILSESETLQLEELAIIKISEPISAALQDTRSTGTSNGSGEIVEGPSPASLEADLTHYKELFSKLRFSYLEQVTKEKFIRAILGDPPLIVEGSENNALEAELLEVKASLKAQKQDVFNMVAELERHGRELSKQHEGIIMQTTRLKELPMEIEQLQASIAGLREQLAPGPNPELNLPLHKTVELVEEKEKESAELDRILEKLQAELPRKTRATERLEAEVQPLEVKKLGSAASAREAQRRKEVALGGIGDDLEERGRWWRGVESGLKAMLDVEN